MVVGSIDMVTTLPGEREERKNLGGGVTVHVPRSEFSSLLAKRNLETLNVPFVSSISSTIAETRKPEIVPALARISDELPSFAREINAVIAIPPNMRMRLMKMNKKELFFFIFLFFHRQFVLSSAA